MTPKIALVYDRVNTPYGGAEQVLLALHQAFPEAPLYTSVYHPRAKWADTFEIKTSFLQKIPFANYLHRFLVPLMPLAFESFNLSSYDIIISITSAEAKGVITKPNQLHICYMLTPTRYLYSHRPHYEQAHWPFKVPILKYLSNKLFDYLTWWDQAAAHRPDVIIPISNLVKDRIEKHYQRQADQIIYPPIAELQPPENTASFKPYYLPQEYLLVVSRLVPYKRVDLAIHACQRLSKNLVIIGDGPQRAELEKLAGKNIYFLGNVTQIQRQAILNQAQALLMPGIEDFGITAIEAVISQIPVILHQKSGAAELLKNEKVAVYLTKLSIDSLSIAIQKLAKTEFSFSPIGKSLAKYAINDFAKRFQVTVFKFWQSKKKYYG